MSGAGTKEFAVKYGPALSAESTAPAVGWRAAPPDPALQVRTVHLWHGDLRQIARHSSRLEQNLSTDERVRANRFRFTRDRERFVASRGMLREVLALYLGVAPRQLSFGYGAHGKPFLAGHGALRFNVSHCRDTVLVAVAREREVGVDIEYARDSLAAEEFAATVLSAPERHALSRLGGEARRMALLRLWTRKEACIKLDGRGLSLPLEHIDVSAPAGRVAVLDEAMGEWRARTDLTLRTLAVGYEHAAALAVEGRDDLHLACWRWPGAGDCCSPSAESL